MGDLVDTTVFRRPLTAQESVLGAVRQALVDGELVPGQPIRQEALARRFGTSRAPLREALNILEGEGLVTRQPHRGFSVAGLSDEDLVEARQLMALLEDELVVVALPRLTAVDFTVLERLLADCEFAATAAEVNAVLRANRRFHCAFAERAGRPRFLRLFNALWDLADAHRLQPLCDPANQAIVQGEHRAILDAARERDPARVMECLSSHRHAAWQRSANSSGR